jgi:hypothetical protein
MPPPHTLRPDVLAEIEQDRATRQRKAEEERTDSRIKALDTRLRALEAAPRPAPPPDESFYRELVGICREYVDIKFGRLKNENEALMNRIKLLETQPQLEYKGVYEPGMTYLRNALVTFDGSLWISKSNTGSSPGNPGGSHWKLVCKRGRDGKDGKDGKDWRNEKGWPTS